ncbi:hypothetical protein J7L48_10940 [bacterium]|nr:hypothetical protein [bacterium]
MVGIIIFLIFGAGTVALTLLGIGNGSWWPAIKMFIKGGLPFLTAFIAFIALFIGINDIKDASLRKKELSIEEETEEKVEEAKEEEKKEE